MFPSLLLQRYRLDRRRLLEFVISSHAPSAAELSDEDLDTVSVDLVLDRVQSGGVLDMSEATRRFFDEIDLPSTICKSSGNLYFCISKPESSGSPPRRAAPQTGVMSNHSPCSKEQADHFVAREAEGEISTGVRAASVVSSKTMKDATTLSLGLPSLSTGSSKGCLMMICGKQPMTCFLLL